MLSTSFNPTLPLFLLAWCRNSIHPWKCWYPYGKLYVMPLNVNKALRCFKKKSKLVVYHNIITFWFLSPVSCQKLNFWSFYILFYIITKIPKKQNMRCYFIANFISTMFKMFLQWTHERLLVKSISVILWRILFEITNK